LALYRTSLAFASAFARQGLANADWQDLVSVSQEKIGDTLSDQGDLGAYRTSLAIRERLSMHKTQPMPGWQRDLAISLRQSCRYAARHERRRDSRSSALDYVAGMNQMQALAKARLLLPFRFGYKRS
jgi:hypothetical protein